MNITKFTFTILVLVMAAPVLLFGQNYQNEKYMAGAVPEIGGKVVFERELNVPLFSKDQIYNALVDWATKKFSGKSNRVISTDNSQSTVLLQGENEMVIKIGLFPGKVKMHYILAAECSNGKCTLKTTRVRYTNNPASKNSSDIITAEEYITDKYALNKTKTKIFKGTGDYRIQTIDIVDNIAKEAQDAIFSFNSKFAKSQSAAEQSAPTVTGTENTNAQQHSVTLGNIPEQIIKAVAERGLSIVSAGGRQLNRPIAGKGALNITAENASAMISIEEETDNIMFIMELANNYTLALMDESGTTPVILFNCKKSQQFNKTFIGEILSVFNK